MVNLVCESGVFPEMVTPTTNLLTWEKEPSWDNVTGLEEQQKRCLNQIYAKGVFWKENSNKEAGEEENTGSGGVAFRLEHGGNVEADGNCLFTASRKAMAIKVGVRDLRQRTVARFLDEYGLLNEEERKRIDEIIAHLYSPDLRAGWGIHVVQEVKILVKKEDRQNFDASIQELVDLGIVRESAAESIYKERGIAVNNGRIWARYMSICGSDGDEYDIITLQYTEDGLLSVDENRDGRSAAFGDDIAIESLATEFKREIYVVQAHGSDAMVDEDNCIFFLPHRPRGQICGQPFFLFMKGTGWCGAGGDHYEPLIASTLPFISPEKAAIVL